MAGKAFLALGAALLGAIGVAALAAGGEPAVQPGNVLLLHSDERLTRRLRELAEQSAGAPSPALVAAGQAVLVERRPGVASPVVAVATTHELEASGPDDPALRDFIEHWLGRGP